MSVQSCATEVIIRIYNNKAYHIWYVPCEVLPGVMGYAIKEEGTAYVRDKFLFQCMKDYVTEHEFYHLIDGYSWGGIFGKELRAEFHAFVRYPIGGLCLYLHALFHPKRIKKRLEYIFLKKHTL